LKVFYGFVVGCVGGKEVEKAEMEALRCGNLEEAC
jgi:hypothetical protein